MTAKVKRRTRWRKRVSYRWLADEATSRVATHQVHLDSGYILAPGSGAWFRKNGGTTYRFVYRHRRFASTITHVIRTA